MIDTLDIALMGVVAMYFTGVAMPRNKLVYGIMTVLYVVIIVALEIVQGG